MSFPGNKNITKLKKSLCTLCYWQNFLSAYAWTCTHIKRTLTNAKMSANTAMFAIFTNNHQDNLNKIVQIP